MTKRDIIDVMGRRRMVEAIVRRNCADMPERDRDDLAQYVYEVLLKKPESIIRDLWQHDEMEYYVVRIVLIQRGSDSAFYRTFTAWRVKRLRIEINYGATEEED